MHRFGHYCSKSVLACNSVARLVALLLQGKLVPRMGLELIVPSFVAPVSTLNS